MTDERAVMPEGAAEDVMAARRVVAPVGWQKGAGIPLALGGHRGDSSGEFGGRRFAAVSGPGPLCRYSYRG